MKRSIITPLRHLWRYRLFTLLNIFGLAISISACWIIYRIVSHEFSYEKEIPARENTYRLITNFNFDGKESRNGGVAIPMYQAIREEVSGLDYVVPVSGMWVKNSMTNQGGNTIEEPASIVSTDSAYFKMLPYQWLAGNAATALSSPENVVLTQSRAKTYFPNKSPQDILNQTITYYTYNDTLQKTVSGIVADLDFPTEFIAQEFFTLPAKIYDLVYWTNTNGSDRLYLQFAQNASPAKSLEQVNRIAKQKEQEFQKSSVNAFRSDKYKRWFKLLPLTESHFATDLDTYEMHKASKTILFGLVGISIFLLVLACINYINMSVAQIPQRTKEIGVRKTLGSSQWQLISQFLNETALTTLLAFVLACVFSWLGFSLLRDIIPAEIVLFDSIRQVILFAVSLLIVTTLLAGIYPAWLITRVRTANVFRSSSNAPNGRQGFSLQKALIVFQFVIALVFISCALITGNQLRYTLKSDMGFNKDAVIITQVPWKYQSQPAYQDKQFILANELKKLPGIQSVSLGSQPLTEGYSSSVYQYQQEGKQVIERTVFQKWVDTTYIRLYEMKLLAGRNLRQSDTTNEFVINEAAVRAFGFASPADALDKLIGQSGQKFPIVGVVKDFHLRDFYNTIEPVAMHSNKSNMSVFNIKLNSHDPEKWQSTIKAIENKWAEFYPAGSYQYKFYDETLQDIYEQERNLAKLINLATAITILISCLGLFGLVTLTAFQRTKEIGIRKVLGASATGIVQLLSKEYIKLVIVAFAIAIPIAWWAMNKWLEKFAYRIEIQWWMFALAGGAALIIALFTVSFQAIKAAVANPVKSLRTE